MIPGSAPTHNFEFREVRSSSKIRPTTLVNQGRTLVSTQKHPRVSPVNETWRFCKEATVNFLVGEVGNDAIQVSVTWVMQGGHFDFIGVYSLMNKPILG